MFRAWGRERRAREGALTSIYMAWSAMLRLIRNYQVVWTKSSLTPTNTKDGFRVMVKLSGV